MSIAFAATASDPDGDTLRYTWDFGDGSQLVVGSAASHVYTKAGIYNFTVFVDDMTGLPGHNVSSSAQARMAFLLGLVAGWNFVSVPPVGWGYKSSTLGLSIGDAIVRWDNSTRHVYLVGITDYHYDFPIKPGEGYWVWVASAKTLHLYGTIPTETQTINIYVPNSGGWFPVGLNSLKAWRAHEVAAMYSGPGAISAVVVYKPYPSCIYLAWLSLIPAINDLLIMPGTGMWVWATAPGALIYDP